jgi:type VI secretion system secreted protein VgrG
MPVAFPLQQEARVYKHPFEFPSSQDRRLIKLDIDLGDDYDHDLLLDSFTGTEAVSEGFSFELSLLSRDPYLALKAPLYKKAQLRIQINDHQERIVDGYITRFAHVKNDGGLNHYTATLSPWLWFLTQRVDSRIFQDVTLYSVLCRVFSHYQGMSKNSIDMGDQSPNRRYSCITQFNETDEQFVRRLLEEAGLMFYFGHDDEGHTFIVRDGFLPPKELEQQPIIEFHAKDVPGKVDCISEWSAERHLQPADVSMKSFDYKGLGQQDRLISSSTCRKGRAGRYERYQFHGQFSLRGMDIMYLARTRADELHAAGKTFHGVSNCRAMLPGYRFTLAGHPRHCYENDTERRERGEPSQQKDGEFLLLMVQHSGHNNYLSSDNETYSNTFTAVRSCIPYRPPCLTPRPVMPGPLTALVVGESSQEEVLTDEYGRVRVKFHWQREQQERISPQYFHSEHSAWLRVAQPSAGERFGHQFLPRIGQEVVVSFIAGDINQPLITGTVYNIPNQPPTFSEVQTRQQLPANCALSGIMTKEHNGEGYNELLFDDTPDEVRTRLASSYQDSALNLGRLTTPRDLGKATPRGHGAELRTDASIALRAAQGLLLTTHAQHQVQDDQLECAALKQLLAQCADLFKSMGQTASGQGAQPFDHAGLDGLRQALDRWPAPDSAAKGEPLIAMASEAGIVSATAACQVHYAGENHHTTAQDHVHLTSGAAMHLHAGKGISAFAQDEGIRALANRGKVLVQAQDDDIALNAQKNLHASAAEGEIVLTAPVIRLVADDGSYIKIGGGVEIGSSGKVITHAAKHQWLGAKTDSADTPGFGRDPADQRTVFHYPGHSADNAALAADTPYEMKLEDGTLLKGIASALGLSQMIESGAMQKVEIAALREQKPPSGTASPGAQDSATEAALHSEQFQLVDKHDESRPLTDHPYTISSADGHVWQGTTDANGMTERVHTAGETALDVDFSSPDGGVTIE